MTGPTATGHSTVADLTWASLAPLVAARPTMRLWRAADGFALRARLTVHRPAAPAAVSLFSRGRTRLLVFDLDAKRADPGAVVADRERIIGWLSECGARFVSDRSTSGGVHILVPLARAVPIAMIEPLMRAAARSCPTLDISPMLHPRQGAITVPGSACREGGSRVLDGDLGAAVDVFGVRNRAELLTDLGELLGAAAHPAGNSQAEVTAPDEFFEGEGDHAHLCETYRRGDPLPPSVVAFAETGVLPAHRRSASEARQSVLVHAMWRGWSLAQVREQIAAGQVWEGGLGAAYRRYLRRADGALVADWAAAQRFVLSAVQKVHACAHRRQVHTRGVGRNPRTNLQRRWLAHAVRWCDTSLRSHPARWTVAAVLQALAVASVRSGSVVNGVAVVGVGGRSLSIGAGLVSEGAVWAALRMLRDTPGSPVLLVSAGSGVNADRYALVTPDVVDSNIDGPGRPQVVDVHPVWSVIGQRYRRLYELISASPELTVTELAGAACMSRSSTFDGIAELARVGLVVRRRGRVLITGLTLDQLGEQHSIGEYRAERIQAHQDARAKWREWLATRENPSVPPAEPAAQQVQLPSWDALDTNDHEDCVRAMMATGPPVGVG